MPRRKTKKAQKSARRQQHATWKPAERLLFEFWDGARRRKADPLEISLRLAESTEVDIGIDLKIATAKMAMQNPKFAADQAAAIRRLVGLAQKTFGAKPYDDATGEGLTGPECIALLTQFSIWAEDIAKKNGAMPTWQSVTEPPSSATTPGESPTTPTLASGSTDIAQPSAAPPSSPTLLGSVSVASRPVLSSMP